jgi:hypothetical protein
LKKAEAGEIWLEKAAQADQADAQVSLAEYLLKGNPNQESVAGASHLSRFAGFAGLGAKVGVLRSGDVNLRSVPISLCANKIYTTARTAHGNVFRRSAARETAWATIGRDAM